MSVHDSQLVKFSSCEFYTHSCYECCDELREIQLTGLQLRAAVGENWSFFSQLFEMFVTAVTFRLIDSQLLLVELVRNLMLQLVELQDLMSCESKIHSSLKS